MTQQKDNKRKLKGKWLFLAIVVLIYALIAFIDLPLARESFLFFGDVVLKIIPILLVVFVLMVIFNLLLTPKRIQDYLGKASGLKGWLLALLGGVLATGPIYTWYILIGDLKKQGMQTSLAAAFLYSRAVKLPLFPLLLHYFGLSYTLILTVYLIVFAIVSGTITSLLADRSRLQQ
jgi:uncharacterized membrane protein YraQ (UPF0718 family)